MSYVGLQRIEYNFSSETDMEEIAKLIGIGEYLREEQAIEQALITIVMDYGACALMHQIPYHFDVRC